MKALLVGERADSYGANGPNLTHEVKSALQEDQRKSNNRPKPCIWTWR